MIIPKRKSMIEGLENVIVSLYAKGISVSDIEEQIREVYDFDVSPATISRITDKYRSLSKSSFGVCISVCLDG